MNQIELLTTEHAGGKTLPKRLLDMIAYYGAGPDGATCGQCAMLMLVGGVAHRYFKCNLSRKSHSAATDWRKSWPACGQFLDTGL
jgi:hypothetical protein